MKNNCVACNGRTIFFCKLSGKFDPTKTLRKNQYIYYSQCSFCGTIQQDPLPTEKYLSKLVSKEYSNNKERLKFERLISDNAEQQHRVIVKKIINYDIHNHVLEVGTGIGNLCSYLIKSKIDCQGIDISPELVAYAKKRGLPVSLTNINDLKLNNIYSAIIMSHVFEHLSDPEAKLRKIHKLLKSKGLFLTAQPTAAMTNILSRIIRLNNLNKQSALGIAYINLFIWHIVIYSIKGMEILAKRNGFKLINVIPMPSVKSAGILGVFKKAFNTFNQIGEKLFPQKWPFHVAHLFIFRKK